MSFYDRLLENTRVYQLWQAPFAESKWAPIQKNNDLNKVRRVLDVSCGPGTNTRHFLHHDYVGIDINEDYISFARDKYGKRFIAADVTRWESNEEPFDFIILNSFLHHIDDQGCRTILNHLRGLLDASGSIHILDLVLPEEASAARWLARADRGGFARPLQQWQDLFSKDFTETLFQPYSLGLLGVDLWKMVYFRGTAKDTD